MVFVVVLEPPRQLSQHGLRVRTVVSISYNLFFHNIYYAKSIADNCFAPISVHACPTTHAAEHFERIANVNFVGPRLHRRIDRILLYATRL